MIKKLNLILIFLLLLCLSFGAVSAADDADDVISINEVEITDIDNSSEILSASSYDVSPENYDKYFDSSGQLKESSVASGDTLKFSGEFSNKNFILTKNLNIIGSDATIKNGIITLKSGASGSEISGLKIINTGDNLQGFFFDGATNCNVHDNTVNNTGISSYPFCLNSANDNRITNNLLQTMGATYGHGSRSTSVIVLGESNGNYIAENTIYCADANAIYLSNYGNGGAFKGGPSYNNTIYKNVITYTVNPTSWAYAIQLMGGNNTVDSNVINGAYRGISSSNIAGNKAINNIIHVKGVDFSTNASTGGDYGIALASDAVIRNNTIDGVFTGAGISAGDNSLIEDNYINASKGYGVEANGNDVVIKNNEIYTVSSAVVYQQGKYDGIIVDRNTLVSESGIGVLLSKASKTKYPSNITITNNKISTSNTYRINAADADKDSYTIKNNTGAGKDLTPAGEVDPSVPDFVFDGTTHYITPDNYHSFIDTDGNLMNDVVSDGDILNFKGEFSDKQILLTKSVKVTGDNPVFLNSTFIVTSDAVWIENLTIINKGAERYNAWAIFVADTQTVKIVNNDISVSDPAAAYAVYIYLSSKVYVENNRLYSNGESLTYTLLGYGAENSEFKNNVIECLGTGEIHGFEDTKNINANTSEVCIGQCLGDVLKEHCLDGTNIVPEIYRTYGILMIKSSNNTVDRNKVHVTSLVNQSLAVNSTNSLVGIDFYYDCDNNIVSNNNITVEGKDNYLYGAGALAQSTGQFSSSTAKNNTFTKNIISVSGYNVVEGLIFGQGCEDTVMKENSIELNTERTAYGINLEASEKSDIENNDISINAGIAYGIEAYASSNNKIIANNITGVGKTISGIAGIKTSNNLITDNKISSQGDGSSLKFNMHDVINAPNSGIFIDDVSTGNKIVNNTISTLNGYPVDLMETPTKNDVTDNFLKGGIASGDEGVNRSADNHVENNYANTFENLEMDNLSVPYMDTAKITVKGDKSYDGAAVVFKIGDEIIGEAEMKNGKASLSYDLSDSYPVGNYTVTASLSKSKYKSEEISAELNVVKANYTVNVDDVKSKAGVTAPITATLTDVKGNPIASTEVKFYRNSNYVGAAITGSDGVATLSAKIPAGLSGDFTIFAYVSENENYLQSVGEGKLTITGDAKIPTQILVDDVTMYCFDGTRLYATLKDLDGNVIKNAQVTFTLNGVPLTSTTKDDGRASSPLKLNVGNYTAEIVYKGDKVYEAAYANATVTIKSAMVSNDVELMYMDGTRFYLAVIVNGKPVAGEEIVFNINGVLYTRTTGANGVTSMPLKLNPKTYIVTAQRTSTGEKVSNTATVKSLLSENKDIKMYFRNGSAYTVKVTKQDGKVAGKGEIVTFNINGVLYNRSTNESGIAKLNLNLIPNDYVITADYKGCKVSNKIKILNVLSASDLTKKFSEAKAFNVKLVGGQGKPLANATVTFNINGVMYNRVTNESGIAKLNIRLMQGKYIITSSYNGVNIANTVTVTD